MNYYKSIGSTFLLMENKSKHIIILLISLFLLVYFLLSGQKSNDIPLWIFFLIPISIFLFRVGRTVRFDAKNRSLKIMLVGRTIQQYDLRHFQKMAIVHHKTYFFFNNGKEVKCVFEEGAKSNQKEVSIIRKNKFNDLNDFLSETEAIIEICTQNI